MYSRFQIEVVDTPFNPSDSSREVKIHHSKEKRPLYRVFLYLAGPDLPFVKRVTYHLHPTLSPQTQLVERSATNPDCRLELWLWGTFVVKAIVEDAKRNTYEFKHPLEFTRYFDEATFKREKLSLGTM